MFLILLILFVALPIAEIAVFFRMASAIGFFSAVGWIILVSIVGIWLVKRQGLSTLRRLNRRVASGEVPTRELLDGLFILAAGALMLFPGFLTDVVAILLLLPPVRALFAIPLKRRFAAGPVTFGPIGVWSARRVSGFRPGGNVVDAESWDVTDTDPRKELP